MRKDPPAPRDVLRPPRVPARGPFHKLTRVARLLVVVPSETDPPARLGGWLADAGLTLDERHLGLGEELPESLDGHDGLVVLGGPQSATDDEATSPELVGVRALLREAIAHCESVGDFVSRKLFADILESEEEHIDWIETQLALIERIGEQNYLAQQIEG